MVASTLHISISNLFPVVTGFVMRSVVVTYQPSYYTLVVLWSPISHRTIHLSTNQCEDDEKSTNVSQHTTEGDL